VQDTAVNVRDTASDGIKVVSSQVSESVAQIQPPPFLKDFFTPDKAKEIEDTVSKGIKAVSSVVSDVKIPQIETPQFLKDLFAPRK
jgi:hypothetical protein